MSSFLIKPTIYNFDDFHHYLKECFDRNNDFGFTYGYISQIAEIQKRVVFSIINNQRNLLQKRHIEGFSKVLEHDKKEADYFEAIVFLTKARNARVKNQKEIEYYLNKALKIKNSIFTPAFTLNKDQIEYVSEWYHFAIRSLLGFMPFNGDYFQLANKLSPSITEAQAKQSIQLLERLCFIYKKSDGYYHITENKNKIYADKTIAKMNNFRSLVNFFALGTSSIRDVPQEKRYVISSTLGISYETYEIIRDEIKEFNDRICNLASNDKKADCLYQFNVALFPISK